MAADTEPELVETGRHVAEPVTDGPVFLRNRLGLLDMSPPDLRKAAFSLVLNQKDQMGGYFCKLLFSRFQPAGKETWQSVCGIKRGQRLERLKI